MTIISECTKKFGPTPMAEYEISNRTYRQFKKDVVKLLVYLGVGGVQFIAKAFTVRYHLEYYQLYDDWSRDKFEHFFEEIDGERLNHWTIRFYNDHLYVE